MKLPSSFVIDDPSWALIQSEISYWGTTSANGNAGGTTLVCADLANHANYLNLHIKVLDGVSAGQVKRIIVDFAGTITVDYAFTNAAGAAAQQLAGIRFVVLSDYSPSGPLFFADHWSFPAEELVITNVVGDIALPVIQVNNMPANVTYVYSLSLFKFRMVENTNGVVNSLNGAQVIQIRNNVVLVSEDAIHFADHQFTVGGNIRESGGELMGFIRILPPTTAGNGTYDFKWPNALAHLPNLQFNDFQIGLRIYYRL